MSSLPLPQESARLSALSRYQVLDTAPSAAFDNIVYLAARIAGTSMAYLAFLDGHREWCKARFGWPTAEVPREFSLSAAALEEHDVLAVSDARTDARFANHPWVCSERHLRSFVLLPLRSPDGFTLGTLAVADREVREFSAAQYQALKALAQEVLDLLEQRREEADAESAPALAASAEPIATSLRFPLALAPAAPAEWPEWWISATPLAAAQLGPDDRWLRVNPAWCSLLGYSPAEAAALTLADVLHPADYQRQREAMERLRRGELAQFTAEQRYLAKHRATIWVRARILLPPGSPLRLVMAEDITERKRAEDEVRLLQGLILAAGGASDTPGALRIALYQICEATGWDLGQAWVPNPNQRELRLSPAYFARYPGLERFRYLQADQSWTRGEGEPGRAWAGGKPNWIADVWAEGGFRRQDAARECGLRASLVLPVFAGEELATVLELFAREPREADARLLRVAGTVATQLGATLSRRGAEEAWREQDARLRLVLEHMPVVAWTANRQLQFTSVHGAALAALGLQADDLLGAPLRAAFAVREDSPLLAAHRRALAGEARQCDLEWKGRGWRAFLAPLPGQGGQPGGVAGLALDLGTAATAAPPPALETVARLAQTLAEDARQLLAAMQPGPKA